MVPRAPLFLLGILTLSNCSLPGGNAATVHGLVGGMVIVAAVVDTHKKARGIRRHDLRTDDKRRGGLQMRGGGFGQCVHQAVGPPIGSGETRVWLSGSEGMSGNPQKSASSWISASESSGDVPGPGLLVSPIRFPLRNWPVWAAAVGRRRQARQSQSQCHTRFCPALATGHLGLLESTVSTLPELRQCLEFAQYPLAFWFRWMRPFLSNCVAFRKPLLSVWKELLTQCPRGHQLARHPGYFAAQPKLAQPAPAMIARPLGDSAAGVRG